MNLIIMVITYEIKHFGTRGADTSSRPPPVHLRSGAGESRVELGGGEVSLSTGQSIDLKVKFGQIENPSGERKKKWSNFLTIVMVIVFLVLTSI